MGIASATKLPRNTNGYTLAVWQNREVLSLGVVAACQAFMVHAGGFASNDADGYGCY